MSLRASSSSSSGDGGGGGEVFDRVVLTEDQSEGQRVRSWLVEWSADSGASWQTFGSGESIGNKRILLAPSAQSYNATSVRLTVLAAVPTHSGVTLGVVAAAVAGGSGTSGGGGGGVSVGRTPVRATISVYPPCSSGTPATIRKLGTEDIGMTETTPVVWQGGLYRFESVRSGHWNNTLNCTRDVPGQGRQCLQYLRFRHQAGPEDGWRSGAIATSPFGVGWALACAVVDDTPNGTGAVWAFASQEGPEVAMFSSATIAVDANWTQAVAITLPAGYSAFNTAVAPGCVWRVVCFGDG